MEIDSELAAEIVVYTLAWANDHPREPGERVTALLNGRVVVNGEEIRQACGIEIATTGGDFVEAKIRVNPGSIRFVTLDRDDFNQKDLP